jgi:hypothetical protein
MQPCRKLTINVRITAVRKLAVEAADNGLLAPELAAGITDFRGVHVYLDAFIRDSAWRV